VQLYEYLQILENRLFSAGLHTLGELPEPEQMASYLQAYFGGARGDECNKMGVGTQHEHLEEALQIRNLLNWG